MKTYLLVHGAWHGGWVWRPVAERLRWADQRVFTPTLTGCGERSHLIHPENNLDLHIRDVLSVIEHEELDDVILCGHSYAGMVITGVAEHLETRLRALVYVDAYVPKDGDCVLDLRPAEDNRRLHAAVARMDEDWRMPARSAEEFGVRRQADREWVNRHLTDMAIGCFEQPLQLKGIVAKTVRRVYVRAGDFPNETFDAYYARASESRDWSARMIAEAGHDIMVDQPGPLAELLLAIE